MTCRECLDLFGGYLDGELPAALSRQLDVHLAACASCRTLFDGCRQTIQAYRRQPVPELPAALHRKIMDRLRDRPKSTASGHPTPRPRI